jgi:hypothetical protein
MEAFNEAVHVEDTEAVDEATVSPTRALVATRDPLIGDSVSVSMRLLGSSKHRGTRAAGGL